FMKGIAGSAAAWPLAARAQQAERMQRIGVLMNTAVDDPEGQARIAAFHQGLQEWGWTLGRNARIDARWGAVDADSSRRYAAELVALVPDVILASASTALGALQATSQHLSQIGADEIAAAVQLVRVTLWAVPVQLLFPLHHVASAPVLLDQFGDAVPALALAA